MECGCVSVQDWGWASEGAGEGLSPIQACPPYSRVDILQLLRPGLCRLCLSLLLLSMDLHAGR